MSKKLITLMVVSILLVALGMSITSAQEEVHLRLWAHQEPAFNDGLQALIDEYVAANPNVTIEMNTFEYDLFIQTLQTALPAGDEADILVLFGSWVCSYTDHLAAMPEGTGIDTGAFFGATMNGYICDDSVYGLPQEFNLEYGTVLVNEAMFVDAGLDYPPAWENWDALTSDAAAMIQMDDDEQMTVAGYHFTTADAITFSFLAGILQNGGQYWNEDMDAFTFNTDAGRASLEHMIELVDAGVVDPVLFNDEANWSGDAFFTDQTAIALIGPWAVAYGLGDFPDFGDFDYVTLPSFGEEPLFAADSGWGMTVSKNSEHADVAWDFLQFAAATPENALAWNMSSGTIPAMRVLAEDEMYSAPLLEALPWLEATLPLLQYGSFIGNMPDRDLVFYDIIYPYILDTLQGLMDVDEALEYIEEDANSTFE
jgi:multiple sugar transport system substrate-binding protein